VRVRKVFSAASPDYFLLLGTTLFLVIFGLVMVLSSSSIESHVAGDSFFAAFFRQGLFALIGIPLMLLASTLPITFWKRWAWHLVVVSLFLQLLVFSPLGYGYGGNRNWLDLGPVSIQPSELVKLALIVWIALILAKKKDNLSSMKEVWLPIGLVAGASIVFVGIGNDLGTLVIILLIVFGAMFFAGIKSRFLLLPLLLVVAGGLVMASVGSSRTRRISSWFFGCTEADYMSPCWQPIHGTWALAAGGLFGAGLGNSKAKWSWLPEADNDYIFAIIGEELGLVGALVVLVLFILLAVIFMRIIRKNSDPFARVVTSGVMVWIVGQALVNIGVVLGALPVLGVPLPLISAGGSALISALVGIGVVLSFARARPAWETAIIDQTPAERSRSFAARRSQQASTATSGTRRTQ
jgi:cell division protein FtsW